MKEAVVPPLLRIRSALAASTGHRRANSELTRRRCERRLQLIFFFFQAEDGIRDVAVTGVQTCALPISDDFAVAIQYEDWICLLAALQHVDRARFVHYNRRRIADFPVGARRLDLDLSSQIGRASCRERV